MQNIKGRYNSTLITRPSTKKSILSKNSLHGWGVKVAIIDSGITGDVQCSDSIDYTNTGLMDTYNHGTGVAKIIKFFAPGANLYVAKVGAQKPSEAYVLRALKWAEDVGAQIVNLSCGFDENRPLTGCKDKCVLCQTVNYLSSKGIVVVVAAGNDMKQEGKPMPCPACATKAITVGAIDQNGKLAEYSISGKLDKPNILAPGSLYIDGEYFEGTSFAAPIVTGLLASTLNNYPSIEKTIEIMYGTAKNIGLPIYKQGHGIIDIEKFVEELHNEKIDGTSEGYKQN